MPLDKNRAPVAQLPARRMARMIAAVRAVGFDAPASAHLVEAFAPAMIEETPPEGMAALIKATDDMARS